RTPPFHFRFTGEKSVLFAPPPGLRPYSPVPLPFHGGEVRLFAHPPGLWPFSPVSLPFHGGAARFVRDPSRPSAVLPRSTSVSRGRSPFCSRPLPAFGRTPPFHFRSTGENLITDLP